MDILYSHAFFPTIKSPKRITPNSKSLIDNIFYINITKNIVSGNITTSISDHPTQFLLISNQNPFLNISINFQSKSNQKYNLEILMQWLLQENLKRDYWIE